MHERAPLAWAPYNTETDQEIKNPTLPFHFELDNRKTIEVLTDFGIPDSVTSSLDIHLTSHMPGNAQIGYDPQSQKETAAMIKLQGMTYGVNADGRRHIDIHMGHTYNQFFADYSVLLSYSNLAKSDSESEDINTRREKLAEYIKGSFASKRLGPFIAGQRWEDIQDFIFHLLRHRFERQTESVLVHELSHLKGIQERESAPHIARRRLRIGKGVLATGVALAVTSLYIPDIPPITLPTTLATAVGTIAAARSARNYSEKSALLNTQSEIMAQEDQKYAWRYRGMIRTQPNHDLDIERLNEFVLHPQPTLVITFSHGSPEVRQTT